MNTVNQKTTSEQNISTLFEQTEIAKKRKELKENEFNDYEGRYNKGYVSETQYLQQKVSLLSSQKQYVDAAKNYWNALLSYVLSLSIIPEEVLK
jgi:outer membrane protein TolC